MASFLLLRFDRTARLRAERAVRDTARGGARTAGSRATGSPASPGLGRRLRTAASAAAPANGPDGGFGGPHGAAPRGARYVRHQAGEALLGDTLALAPALRASSTARIRATDPGEQHQPYTRLHAKSIAATMQTQLADFIRDTPEGREADAILRKCVHCGFCTATCPTYQVLGDDLDSPRGRIYLIKRVLEGARGHRARRGCTSTAASPAAPARPPAPRACATGGWSTSAAPWWRRGPQRPPWDRLKRAALSFGLPRSRAFRCRSAARASWWALAPRDAAPARRVARARATRAGCWCCAAACSRRSRRRSTRPRRACSIASASRCSRSPARAAAARIRFHLNDQEAGRDDMRALIDAWWPMVGGTRGRGDRDDGERLRRHGEGLRPPARRTIPAYRGKAERISAMTRDLCEVIEPEALPARTNRGTHRVPFALHAAARAAAPRQGRGAAHPRRLRARTGARCAPVLRLGGHLLAAAAGDRRRAARAQARCAARRARRRRSPRRTSAA